MIQSIHQTLESGENEVEIGELITDHTADIISRIIFGRDFDKGKKIFDKLHLLQKPCAEATKHLYLPGSRYVITRVYTVRLGE